MAINNQMVLGALGIAATFAATFLGVYLGAEAQLTQKKTNDKAAYQSLLSVMSSDCQATLELSRVGRDAVSDGFVAQPGILLKAFYENSLLVEQMSPGNISRLAPSLGRAGQHGNRFIRKVQQYDSVQVPPEGLAGVPPGYRQAAIEYKTSLGNQLSDIVKDYSESLSVICEVLKNEVANG